MKMSTQQQQSFSPWDRSSGELRTPSRPASVRVYKQHDLDRLMRQARS